MRLPATIDEYIAAFSEDKQALLETVRQAVKKAAPEAEETIKYGMPTFIWKGNLVHFAAYNSHIGFYPAPSGVEEFRKDLALYQTGKGTMQFAIDKPLPLPLITWLVQYRMNENLKKERLKRPGTRSKNKYIGARLSAQV